MRGKNRIPAYDEADGRGLVRHVLVRRGFSTGEMIVCLVINGAELPAPGQRLVSRTEEDKGHGRHYLQQQHGPH